MSNTKKKQILQFVSTPGRYDYNTNVYIRPRDKHGKVIYWNGANNYFDKCFQVPTDEQIAHYMDTMEGIPNFTQDLDYFDYWPYTPPDLERNLVSYSANFQQTFPENPYNILTNNLSIPPPPIHKVKLPTKPLPSQTQTLAVPSKCLDKKEKLLVELKNPYLSPQKRLQKETQLLQAKSAQKPSQKQTKNSNQNPSLNNQHQIISQDLQTPKKRSNPPTLQPQNHSSLSTNSNTLPSPATTFNLSPTFTSSNNSYDQPNAKRTKKIALKDFVPHFVHEASANLPHATLFIKHFRKYVSKHPTTNEKEMRQICNTLLQEHKNHYSQALSNNTDTSSHRNSPKSSTKTTDVVTETVLKNELPSLPGWSYHEMFLNPSLPSDLRSSLTPPLPLGTLVITTTDANNNVSYSLLYPKDASPNDNHTSVIQP